MRTVRATRLPHHAKPHDLGAAARPGRAGAWRRLALCAALLLPGTTAAKAAADAQPAQIHARALAEIDRAIAELQAHRDNDYTVSLNSNGAPGIDKVVRAIVNRVARKMATKAAMDRMCYDPELPRLLAPANLLAEGGTTAARQRIDACADAIETYRKDGEATRADVLRVLLEQGITHDGDAFLRQLDERAPADRDVELKAMAIQRRALAAQHGVLDLIDRRRDHIHVENNQVRFDSEEDRREIGRLMAENTAAAQAAQDLVDEVRRDLRSRGAGER